MNGHERIDELRRRQAGRRGFTLIELLVVILIILLVRGGLADRASGDQPSPGE